MKTNYEKICAILDSGHKAKVVIYRPCMKIKNEEVIIDSLGFAQTLCDVETTKTYSTEIKSITPIATKPPILEVGTEVIVLDIIKECDYIPELEKNFIIGKRFVIQANIMGHYMIVLDEQMHTLQVPYWCVCKNYLD